MTAAAARLAPPLMSGGWGGILTSAAAALVAGLLGGAKIGTQLATVDLDGESGVCQCTCNCHRFIYIQLSAENNC